MNIKKAILTDLYVGLSKVKIASKYETNVKMVDSILNSPEGRYAVTKIMPKDTTIRAGTSLEEGC